MKKTIPNQFIEIERKIIEGKTYYYPIIGGKSYSQIAETHDMAALLALGIKYDGVNSQFAKMAARMLNIETQWRE